MSVNAGFTDKLYGVVDGLSAVSATGVKMTVGRPPSASRQGLPAARRVVRDNAALTVVLGQTSLAAVSKHLGSHQALDAMQSVL